MNQSTINFLVKTLGADQAAREMDKITRAAQKAGTTVKKYLNTNAGEAKLVAAQVKGAAARAEQQAASTEKVAAATDRASTAQKNYFGHIARTTIQSALINKLFLELVDVSGQAIQQVDLMKNFPATMASMGQSTTAAGKSMDALQRYVGQVGGNLGNATSYVTRFVGATGDVKAATAIFVGLNNALIAGDSSLEEQRQATIQFAQALERGKPDLREWRNLTQNMSFQLAQVAEAMGYVNANALGEALTSGQESMAAFTTTLTELSTGTGVIAQQAQARMNGMQFAFNVLKNTMVQGLAAIINAIGRQNIVSFFSFLTQVVQVLAQAVVKLIKVFVTLFNFFARLFGLSAIQLKNDVEGVAEGIGAGAGNAEDLGDGLKGAGKEAKKLNKSLASFDKMNVLPDKESASGGGSGSGKDGAGAGGAGFDADQLGKLGDLFDGIGGGLQEAGKWARIFAGILIGLAGIKFAQGIINQIDGIVKSFKTARSGIGTFKKSLIGGTDENGKKVDGLAQKIGGLPLIITNKVVPGFKTGFAKLGKFMTNPFVLVATAIAAVVGGILYLYNTNEGFKRGFDSVWKGVGDIIKSVADIFKAIMQPALDALKKAWDGLLNAIKPITVTLQPLIDKIKEFLSNLFPGVSAMELFGKIIGTVAAVIAGVIIAAFTLLATAIGAVVYALIWLGTKVIEIVTVIADFFVKNFGGIKDALVDFVKNGIEWMGNRFSDIVGGIKAAWNGLLDFFRPAVQFFQEVFTKVKDAIITVWNEITDPVKEQFNKLGTAWSELTKVFTDQIDKLKKVWDEVVGEIVKIWDEQMKKLTEAWNKFYTKIEPGIKKIQELHDQMKKAIGEAVDTIKKKFTEFKESIQPLIDAVSKFYNDHIKPMIQGIKDWFTENEVLKKALQAIGIVLAVVILAPLALVLIAVGLVVAVFAALAFAILWVVTKLVEFASYIIGGGLWEDIQQLVAATGQWIQDKFNEAWKFVKSIFGGIGEWFKQRWENVKANLAMVGTWFKEKFQEAWDNIVAIWTALGDFFKERWENLKSNLAMVGTWFKERFQEAWNGVVAIWNGVGKWFTDRYQDIKNVFNGIKTWFSNKFKEGYEGLKSVFSGVKEWFKTNVIDKILNTFSGIKNRITGFFSGVWDGLSKGLKDALNSILKLPLTIPSVTIAGKTIGGQTLIPRLARGGIIDQATLAVVGESGREAIVPLENNTEWINKLADKINTTSGGGKEPIQLVVQIGEEKIVTKMIDLINEKTQMSGRNTIYV